ncbi:MAG TPA: hypothetical protein VGH20_12555 [Myxococcales bacterium]|jgi:hypothetical protein
MKRKLLLVAFALFGVVAAYEIRSFWPGVEVQVLEAKKSPDGKWTAVVQMEVYETFSSVNDAVYSVRLKGPAQKDRRGDLVLNVPVDAPDAAPFIDWRQGSLMVTLMKNQKPRYLASVGGVAITVQHQHE